MSAIEDIKRECCKFQATLSNLSRDIAAVKAGAGATGLDLVALLTACFGHIDSLRRTHTTIRNHYESLTGRRALPPPPLIPRRF
jgi:hypothetical protein